MRKPAYMNLYNRANMHISVGILDQSFAKMSKRKAVSSSSKTGSDRVFELVSLGRESYASKSAIAKLLAHIEKDGLPETHDRNAQYRARKEVCRKPAGEYGPMVVDVQCSLENKSEPQRFSVQNVFAWLQHACMHSPHFSKIVLDAMEKHPCSPSSPWKLILYQDGVDPSDGLAKNHSRKSAVYYWSFVELGMQALSKEEVWGVVTVARYSEYTQLAGKSASLFKIVLDQFFGETHNLRRTGCSLRFPNGERKLLLAEPSVLLADMPALSECLLTKGHAGIICCPLCVNATLQNTSATDALHELTEAAVSIANTDFNAFTKHTDESIRYTVQGLRDSHQQLLDKKITKAEFEEIEISKGFVWHPILNETILNNRFNLQVASMLMFDGAHIYVHDGLADNELGAFMKVFHSNQSATCYNELGAYVSSFTLPKSAPSLKHLFTTSANKNNAKNKHFSCTGSECLTLAPILARYIRHVVIPRGEFLDHCASMLAVLDVLEVLQAVKTGTVNHKTLRKAIVKHLVLFKTCYGESAFKPKHHYALHLPRMLKNHGFLLMTFTHERKHRLVTRYTRDRKNLRSWDSGAMEEITCHSMFELSRPFYGIATTSQARGAILIPLRELFPGVDDNSITILNDISGRGGHINTGDVVSCIYNNSAHVGELLAAIGINADNSCKSFCIISLWQRDAECTDIRWVNHVVARDNVVCLPLQHLDTVFIHAMSTDRSTCMVYMPLEVRPE